MQSKQRKTLACLGLCSLALTSIIAVAQQQPPAVPSPQGRVNVKGTIDTAVTIPYREQKLWFNLPGIIKKVHVEEGQAIKKDDLLVTQDDDIERAELDRLKLE